MSNGNDPVTMPELNLPPNAERSIDLDNRIKQVLATLTAYAGENRVALRSSPSGALFVASKQLKEIVHKTAAGSPVNQTGPEAGCTEVMCMGHPDNTGLVWVRKGSAATANNAWPLAAGEAVILTMDTVSQLNFLMTVGSEKLIIAYTG